MVEYGAPAYHRLSLSQGVQVHIGNGQVMGAAATAARPTTWPRTTMAAATSGGRSCVVRVGGADRVHSQCAHLDFSDGMDVFWTVRGSVVEMVAQSRTAFGWLGLGLAEDERCLMAGGCVRCARGVWLWLRSWQG